MLSLRLPDPAAIPALVAPAELRRGANPLLAGHAACQTLHRALPGRGDPARDAAYSHYCRVERRHLAHYGYAVPTAPALTLLASLGPLVEIGAGRGYWARLLRDRGVDVQAYDRTTPAPWTTVLRGGPERAGDDPDRSLFLCWPPLDSAMAVEAVRAYAGDTLVSVGEWCGCTADAAYHTELTSHWVQQIHLDLPHWPGRWDDLSVWRRR